jgi:EmrB/QacA subfamily drug resistance transporter
VVWLLIASVSAAGMAFIDATALNVALPALQADLGASGPELLWINNAYALPLAALLLVGGTLGDRFGRRRIYMAGIGMFAAASAGCGLAPNTGALIAMRVAQGVGGALMIPGSLAMITAAVDPERRGRAIGTWSAFSVVATALGPILGGLLARAGFWRAVFFINLPLALLALTILYLKVAESRDDGAPRVLDYPGALMATIGLAGINFGLIEAPARGFGDPLIMFALSGGLIALVLFVAIEAYSDRPLLPLRVFRVRTFTGATLIALCFYSALSGLLFFYPLNLIQIQRYDAALAGLTQLPLMILLVVLSPWAGGLVDRCGPRLPLIAGTMIAGLGFLLFALPGVTSGPADFWIAYGPALIVLGIGMAMTVSPLSTTIMSSISTREAGLASGINSTVARLSGVLAVAVLGSIALMSFGRSLDLRASTLELPADARLALSAQAANLADARVPGGLTAAMAATVADSIRVSFVHAFRLVCCIAAALSWSGSLLAALVLPRRRVSRPTGAPLSSA